MRDYYLIRFAPASFHYPERILREETVPSRVSNSLTISKRFTDILIIGARHFLLFACAIPRWNILFTLAYIIITRCVFSVLHFVLMQKTREKPQNIILRLAFRIRNWKIIDIRRKHLALTCLLVTLETTSECAKVSSRLVEPTCNILARIPSMGSSQDENNTLDFWRDWDLSNLTETEYLNKVLGPKYLSPTLVIPLTIIYVVIFITGIFGNVATCIVIIRNSTMQTSTNCYLFSLAISDLTLLILGLPNEVKVFWQQYPWTLGMGLCKIRAYVSEMSSYVSVLTIVAFSMERYLAICHPLRVYSTNSLKRPICFILAVWSIAMVSATPFAIYTKVNFVEYPPESGNYSADSAICAMLLPDMPKFPLYELSCIVFFAIPMLVILVLYTRMGLKIKRATKEALGSIQGSYIHGDHRRVQSRKSVIKMLSAVVITFFVCWAPFHAQRLLYIYAQNSDYYPDLNEWLYILSGCLYYFSTTVNPILYNVMSIKYRQAFKQTICCKTKQPTNKILIVKKSHPHRCDSLNESHDRNVICSIRHTIAQAKKIFCFTSSGQASIKDSNRNNGNASNFPQNAYLSQKEDSTSTFLFERGHLLAHQQRSNESTTSTKRSEDTVSIAKSSL